MITGLSYRVARGVIDKGQPLRSESEYEGFKNAVIALSDEQILEW